MITHYYIRRGAILPYFFSNFYIVLRIQPPKVDLFCRRLFLWDWGYEWKSKHTSLRPCAVHEASASAKSLQERSVWLYKKWERILLKPATYHSIHLPLLSPLPYELLQSFKPLQYAKRNLILYVCKLTTLRRCFENNSLLAMSPVKISPKRCPLLPCSTLNTSNIAHSYSKY